MFPVTVIVEKDSFYPEQSSRCDGHLGSNRANDGTRRVDAARRQPSDHQQQLMKRRNFIAGIVAAIGALALPKQPTEPTIPAGTKLADVFPDGLSVYGDGAGTLAYVGGRPTTWHLDPNCPRDRVFIVSNSYVKPPRGRQI